VIFGAVIDDAMGGRVRVTVIATGFDKAYRREPREREEPLAEREAGEGFDVPSGVLEVPSFLRRS
jgi:cell division protein FtsZ